MPNTFAITIITIAIVTILSAFIRRRMRDKCLMDFSDDIVIIEETSGKTTSGQLNVENTGLELIYPIKQKDENGYDKTSCILYKNEYPNIQAIIRYYDELSEDRKKEREKELGRTHSPTALRRFKRRVFSFFKMVRDSLIEVVNLLIGQVQKTSGAGAILTSQDQYATKVKQELMSSMGTSFDPLLEKHIGKKVILMLNKGDKTLEYSGVLKDYTAEFIEIMSVDYSPGEEQKPRKADLVIPRKYGIVRHLGE